MGQHVTKKCAGRTDTSSEVSTRCCVPVGDETGVAETGCGCVCVLMCVYLHASMRRWMVNTWPWNYVCGLYDCVCLCDWV